MNHSEARDAARSPLLRTKLAPLPLDNLSLIGRDALIERLFAARHLPLLVLGAPAGYGKSTALALLRRRLFQSGADVAWLSCDAADSEPSRLLEYILAALEQALPGCAPGTASLLRDRANGSVEALLEAFVADMRQLSGDLYLILDDVHRLRHPDLADVARHLLGRLPPRLRLIVSSRRVPEFLRDGTLPPESAGQVIGAEALRLDRAETADYLNRVHQLALAERDVDLLYQRTEGWVTALHLAAQALARQPERPAPITGLTGTERDIADYLTEDVLADLPSPLCRFLEQTSVLDRFTAELCDTLTGRTDSADVLARLQHEQLFIFALEGRAREFRYHPLFAEFLQGRLARTGSPTPLLLAAARWSEAQGLADRAIAYALRARDYGLAVELLERHGGRLVAGNRAYGVLNLLKQVPTEQIREHTVFQLFYAWQLAFDQRFAESEALIEELSGRLMQGRGKAPRAGVIELLGAAQVLKALVLLYQDKLETCLKTSRQWLTLVPKGQPVFRASLACVQAAALALLGDFAEADKTIALARAELRQIDSVYLHVVTSLIEALICKEYGELERGSGIAEAARARVEEVFGKRSRIGGPLSLAYADLLYEQDRHAGILAELPLATTWRDVATPIELINRARLVLVRARFYAGEAEEALADLEAWLLGLQGAGYERVYALAMGCKVSFLLWLHRPNEAERVCLQLERHLDRLDISRYPDAFAALSSAQARLALSERRPEKAQAVLEPLLSAQAGEHQRDRRLRLGLLLSVAYWRKGNSEKAFGLLEQTVREAWERGYRRLFLDDALWLLPLWDAWPSGTAWPGLGEMLREQCRRLTVDPGKIEENQDVNHREREILRLVAAGLSNRDIAQAVHLSEATIKWHLHNLFAKLGVRSRTQAVLKGKSQGLLGEA
ncbi:MAG TPA: LuxR C-terminal-related transcriptional regulator [Pseudomonas sp.]|nr:LuxR C-terminal-related transcriptional regulator [Pseudomonas sp.]